jgi:hypothetical protein
MENPWVSAGVLLGYGYGLARLYPQQNLYPRNGLRVSWNVMARPLPPPHHDNPISLTTPNTIRASNNDGKTRLWVGDEHDSSFSLERIFLFYFYLYFHLKSNIGQKATRWDLLPCHSIILLIVNPSFSTHTPASGNDTSRQQLEDPPPHPLHFISDATTLPHAQPFIFNTHPGPRQQCELTFRGTQERWGFLHLIVIQD